MIYFAVLLGTSLLSHFYLGRFFKNKSPEGKKGKSRKSSNLPFWSILLDAVLPAAGTYVMTQNLKCSLISFATLFVADYMVLLLTVKIYKEKNLEKILLYQTLTFVVLIGLFVCFIQERILYLGSNLSEFRKPLIYLIFFGTMFLFLGTPVSEIVQHAFEKLSGKNPNESSEMISGNDGVGEWIGILERCIIAVFVVADQAAAAGFVLTAKSIARFKKIEEDPDFAERYLLGTLISTGISVVTAYVVRYLLSGYI